MLLFLLRMHFLGRSPDWSEYDIPEPVREYMECMNSFVIVEKDVEVEFSNPHSPHYSIKKKLKVYLNPRDLNEVLEKEPYYSKIMDELIAKCLVPQYSPQ